MGGGEVEKVILMAKIKLKRKFWKEIISIFL